MILSYDYLMQDILQEGWLVAQMACLVSREGHYLAHSSPAMQARHCLGETRDPLELAMLKAMKEKPYGTLMEKLIRNSDRVLQASTPPLGPSCCMPGATRSWPQFTVSILLPGGRYSMSYRNSGYLFAWW